MKRIIAVFTIIVVMASCSTKQKESFYVEIHDVIRANDEDKGSTKTVTEFNESYFSIEFHAIDNEKSVWRATTKIKQPKIDSNGVFTATYRTIVDANGEYIDFGSPQEFFNYMDDKGYEIQSQEEIGKYSAKSYTFKKIKS